MMEEEAGHSPVFPEACGDVCPSHTEITLMTAEGTKLANK